VVPSYRRHAVILIPRIAARVACNVAKKQRFPRKDRRQGMQIMQNSPKIDERLTNLGTMDW
jgi:hypothetical protein